MIESITAILPPWFLIGLIAFGTILGSIAYLILLERKIASWVQDRIGPNRTGLGFGLIPAFANKHMFGLGQPMADGLKFFFKEDYKPKNVDKILFTVAPGLMMIVMIVSAATIPGVGIGRRPAATISTEIPIRSARQLVTSPSTNPPTRPNSGRSPTTRKPITPPPPINTHFKPRT